jgi:hypothetical protein
MAYPSGERVAPDELYAALRDVGVSVFLDHTCLDPGDPWPAVVFAAQSVAQLTLVPVSSRTARAHYETDEIARAIQLYRRDPLLIVSCPCISTMTPIRHTGCKRFRGCG